MSFSFFQDLKVIYNGNRTKVLHTIFVALALSVVSYFCTNLGFSFVSDLTVLRIAKAIQNTVNDTASVPDNVFLVDIQYDQQLIEANVDNQYVGRAAITERKALYEFLHRLDSLKSYNYIFLDVGFEKGDETEYDSLLFSQICRMDRIVIASSDCVDEKYSGLKRKMGQVEYGTTILNTDFMKYEMIDQDGRPAFPLVAYTELGLGKMGTFFNLIYFDDGSLAVNTVCPETRLRIPIEEENNGKKSSNNIEEIMHSIPYHYLNSDLLPNWDDFYVCDNTDPFKGKDILIGNFSDVDNHGTVFGIQYGPVINYNAYLSLQNKEHIYRWYHILIVMVVVALQVIMSEMKVGKWSFKIRKFWFLLLEFLFAWVLSLAMYLLFHHLYDFMIVALLLNIYVVFFKLKRFV